MNCGCTFLMRPKAVEHTSMGRAGRYAPSATSSAPRPGRPRRSKSSWSGSVRRRTWSSGERRGAQRKAGTVAPDRTVKKMELKKYLRRQARRKKQVKRAAGPITPSARKASDSPPGPWTAAPEEKTFLVEETNRKRTCAWELPDATNAHARTSQGGAETTHTGQHATPTI